MLNNGQIDLLRQGMGSSFWKDLMEPALRQRGNLIIKQLIAPVAERSGDYKTLAEDVMRGEIRAIEWMLTVWSQEIQAAQHNDQVDELRRADSPANP